MKNCLNCARQYLGLFSYTCHKLCGGGFGKFKLWKKRTKCPHCKGKTYTIHKNNYVGCAYPNCYHGYLIPANHKNVT